MMLKSVQLIVHFSRHSNRRILAMTAVNTRATVSVFSQPLYTGPKVTAVTSRAGADIVIITARAIGAALPTLVLNRSPV